MGPTWSIYHLWPKSQCRITLPATWKSMTQLSTRSGPSHQHLVVGPGSPTTVTAAHPRTSNSMISNVHQTSLRVLRKPSRARRARWASSMSGVLWTDRRRDLRPTSRVDHPHTMLLVAPLNRTTQGPGPAPKRFSPTWVVSWLGMVISGKKTRSFLCRGERAAQAGRLFGPTRERSHETAGSPRSRRRINFPCGRDLAGLTI